MLALPLMAITASIAANGVALPPEGGLAARSDWAVFDVVGLFRNAPLKVFRSARRRIPRGDARSHGPGQTRLEWCLMPRNFEQRQHMSGRIPVGPYRQRNAIDQGMERPHEQDLTDCDQDAGRKREAKRKSRQNRPGPKTTSSRRCWTICEGQPKSTAPRTMSSQESRNTVVPT